MVRLPKADLTGLTPDEITNLLIENIRAAQTNSSVVGQIVENVSRETWSLVDLQTVRAAASGALHYDVTVRHSRNTEQCGDEHRGLSEVDTVLVERANVLLLDSEREQALELARSLLARELARVDADPTAESAEAIANNSTRRVRKGAQNRPVSTQGTGLVTTPANETGHTIVGGHK
jgi:hypothetical protein